MTYKITKFIGNQSNVNPNQDIVCDEFKDFREEFVKCRKGAKHEGYFVRGECKGTRNDNNIENSRILIIDGDMKNDGSNLCGPRKIHKLLKDMDVNHIIYSTHSHVWMIKNKFRVVVPTDREYIKGELRHNLDRLIDSIGEDIKRVKEMYTWSQPWFYPTRDDPGDGQYKYYEYFKGNDFKIQYVEKVTEEEIIEKDNAAETYKELMSNIRTGKEFHESMNNLIWQDIKQGYPESTIIERIRFIFDTSVESGSKRWQERYDDIERSVREGIEKNKDVEFDIDRNEKEEVVKRSPCPELPGGILGKFIRETEEFMMYRDKTLSFVSGMFIISSIAGRKFNVDINNKDGMATPTALNMYYTIAAETGVGKSAIEDAVENCYFQFPGANGAIQSFFYKGRISGPRALFNLYKDQRSIGVITNEKGLADQSNLGDTIGMKSAWLNLYGQGAWKKYTTAGSFSDKDSNIKSLRAVSVSRIGESTPVELRKAYCKDDQVENGLIPRENIFVIKDIQTKVNRNIRTEYSRDVKDKMEELVNTCAVDCKEDEFIKYIITINDNELYEEVLSVQEKLRQRQADHKNSIYVRAMSSRMFVKMLRYAGIHTVVNKEKNSAGCLLIERDDWEWGRNVVEHEYSQIGDVVNLAEKSDSLDVCKDVCIKIAEMFDTRQGCEINNKECRLTLKEIREKKISWTKVNKHCRSLTSVKSIEGDMKFGKQMLPMEKVLRLLQDLEVVELIGFNKPGGAKKVKILPEFNSYIRRFT